MHIRFILFSMAGLQILWLLAVWVSGTAMHVEKIVPLLIFSCVSAVFVGGMSEALVARIGMWFWRGVANKRDVFVLLISAVLGIGGVYAYSQQGWPDEKEIFAGSRIVAEQGIETFFTQYAQLPRLGLQHPPLVPLLYGLSLHIWGVTLFAARGSALLLALGVALLTYRIGSRFYDDRTGALAAIGLLTMPFFFRLGTSAMLDMPVTFAFVGALLLSLRLQERPSYLIAVALGGCLGLGLLCRYTMALIYPLMFAVCFVDGQFRRLMPYLATAAFVSLGIFSCWAAWAVSVGVFAVQQDKISRLAGYVSTSKGQLWLANVLVFRLPSGLGVYNLPLLLLGGWRLWRERRRSDQIVLIWIAAVCFPLLATLPGPRYFLPAFPAFALLMARGVLSIREDSERSLMLASLYGVGALYLFVDWYRAVGGWFLH